MSAQLAKPGPYEDDQKPDAYAIAYSGPYDVNEQARTVAHQVQVSVIPSWLGTTQIRQVQFPEPDTLVLSASERSPRDGVMTTTTITWSRQPHTGGNHQPASAILGVHMPTRRPPLSYDVFVAPEKPFTAPPPRVGDPAAWDPTTSTLIFGARDAVLVDALMTVREATALADWIALHDRRLTTIYITHGHGDHWLGLSVVLDRFPHARAVATAGTVMQMHRGAQNNASRARFPGQIADTIALVEPLDAEHFELEGLPLQVIETGHTDTVDTTSLYVPDLGLIVSGDVAYNHCHMFVGATTAASRAEWIAALDQLAVLNPAAVVTGHKDPTRGNPPSVLAESRGYLEYYGQLRQAALPDRELFDAMVSRYPDWVSRQEFLLLGPPSPTT
jgi:glyoxylase-like metal-dependent hydrolase (beta-lactamase superfamily II)